MPNSFWDRFRWKKKDVVTEELFIARNGQLHPLTVNQEAASRVTLVDDDIDADDWYSTSAGRRTPSLRELENDVETIRETVENNPYLRRALQLYCSYVAGAEFCVELKPKASTDDTPPAEGDKKKQKQVVLLGAEVLKEVQDANRKAWTVDEFHRRTWRDGEQFTRMFDKEWPMQLRFIDRECIGEDQGQGDYGIITKEKDVGVVERYREIDPTTQAAISEIPADEIVHTKIDVDSNEKRGRSRFYTLIGVSKHHDTFIETEVRHRNLQASIVMVKKVNGQTKDVRFMLDNSVSSTTQDRGYTIDRERIYSGSIINQGKNLDIEFKQPQTNFSDASPLAAMLLMQIAVATGWTYSMISADASGGNLANSIVEEGPVHQMVEGERKFFRPDLVTIFKRVMEAGLGSSKYAPKFKELGINNKEDLWAGYEITFRYGQVVSRDSLKDAQTATAYITNGAWSPQEAARRSMVDPDQMARERLECLENRPDINFQSLSNQQPDMQAKGQSAADNATKGQGGNQGANKPIRHSDNQGVGSSQKA